MHDHRLPFSPGLKVSARDDSWIVAGHTAFADCVSVALQPAGRQAARTTTLLAPFDRIRPSDRQGRLRACGARRLLHELRVAERHAHPWGALRTAASASLDILPYQLAPALAAAAGALRILIADEVGLGKTIQAGLVLSELAARGEAFRALVACPAGLRAQWRDELAARFGLDATLAGSEWLSARARDLPGDVNPWALPGIYVTSFDLVKRPEVLRPLEDVVWDTLVLDEAHNLSAGTARHAALDAIARRARRVILLTATPHSGDPAGYAALTRLGSVERADDPLVVFRRTRADAAGTPTRRSAFLTVCPSRAERRMHALLEDYTARICREARARADAHARLAAVVLRKRALSSAASLGASASRRLDLLKRGPRAAADQLLLPFADEDPLGDAVEDGVLAAPGLSDARQEQAILEQLVASAAMAAARETKIQALIRLLRRLREPAIVFTEYRDTLERLARAVTGVGMPILVLHGGLDPGARAAVQRAFNDGGSVLLATDAASEGLNLQARCRVVIHFELPWAPGRLEQRAGRVDRIGQRRRVHEILLVARDTAERVVLAPLAARAVRVRASNHGTATLALLTESAVAAAILGDGPSCQSEPAPPEESATNIIVRAGGDDSAATAEAARLLGLRASARQGRAASRGQHSARPRRVFVHRARGRMPASVTSVYACELLSPCGRVEHGVIRAVRLPLRPGDAGGRLLHAARRWRAAHEATCRQALEASLYADLALAGPRHEAAMAALERREAALAAAIPSAARALVQAGLFDRRAVAAAVARRRAAADLLEAAGEKLERLRGDRRLTPTTRLLALIAR